MKSRPSAALPPVSPPALICRPIAGSAHTSSYSAASEATPCLSSPLQGT